MTDRTPKYVTLPGLRQRGWSDVLVRKLLGEPRHGLYEFARVRRAELSPDFAPAGEVSAGQRRLAVLAAVRVEPIHVPRLDPCELAERALRHRDVLDGGEPGAEPSGDAGPAAAAGAAAAAGPSEHAEHAGLADPGGGTGAGRAPGASSPALEAAEARRQVNYLRQALSRYETLLEGLSGAPEFEDAERLLRQRVYDAIADAYPALAPECRRQLRERDGSVL